MPLSAVGVAASSFIVKIAFPRGMYLPVPRLGRTSRRALRPGNDRAPVGMVGSGAVTRVCMSLMLRFAVVLRVICDQG